MHKPYIEPEFEDQAQLSLSEVQKRCDCVTPPAYDGDTLIYTSTGKVFFAKTEELEVLKGLRSFKTVYRLKSLEQKLNDYNPNDRFEKLSELAEKREVGFLFYTGDIDKDNIVGVLSTLIPLVQKTGLDSKMEFIDTIH